MPDLTLPEAMPYLLAILGLLLLWLLYKSQILAGRVKAADPRDRSGVRLFLHVTPADTHVCPACRVAKGMAFLPNVIASKQFRPMDRTCTNPAGCRCLLVGLYGAWPEAERVRAQLGKYKGRIKLSNEEFDGLVDGSQGRRAGIVADQVSVAILEALRAEGSNPDLAIERYRFAVDNAKRERDLGFIVPAYLRLTDLLEQRGHLADALDAVERFSIACGNMKEGADLPTEAQLALMSLRKTRLLAALKKTEAR
jgi:hypothetical protein